MSSNQTAATTSDRLSAPLAIRKRSCRDRFLDKAWDMRRCNSSGNNAKGLVGDVECRLMVKPRGRAGRLCMDMEEVKACRDLGLSLPCDWTVEIAGADGSGDGSSPVSDWNISSPGDDPSEIKARLKVWAQAVALASSSRLNN